MARRAALALTLLFLPLAVPLAASEGTETLRITEVLPDPATDEREFLEIHNPGNASVDLVGWQVQDAAENTYTFGNLTLSAGARIVVWSGGEDDALGPAWSMTSVWNNGGDEATLVRPDGTTADSLAYGTAEHPAPAKGQSLQLLDGTWIEGEPTPGAAPGAEGGTATATVDDVAPTVAFSDVPDQVRAGASFDVAFDITEDNGDDVTWSLEGDGAMLATGSGTGTHQVSLSAPTTAGHWTLQASASDGGLSANTSHALEVRAGDLAVEVPEGGVRFPSFAPGSQNITALDTFTIENLADQAVAPRIDVSPFRSGDAAIPVEGHLQVGLRSGNGTWDWTPYTAPLEPLPEIAAGATVEVSLRLDDVPSPLPAGDYGTSFTVVA